MLPFSDMPYGYAPIYCFPLTGICMYVLLLICGWHAGGKGVGHISWLLGGLGFGLLLEYVNVTTSSGYRYGQFWLMLGTAPRNIPLCIGCGWAVIIYSSRLFTDNFGLPVWAAAALDSLLALNIDLSMDVVAYRLHMWHWDWESKGLSAQALTGQWFGVPYANFYGWLLVVFFYSLFGRLLEKRLITASWKAAIPLLSILISQVALWLSLFPIADLLKQYFGITSAHRLVALLALFVLLTIAGYFKRKQTGTHYFPLAAWIVPLWFHMYFLAWLFLGGFSGENRYMMAFSICNVVLASAIHLPMLAKKKNITILAPTR
ncbi:uncharacterized protein DUF422 [Chitinophaga polysaccharea]|uniref:Uncharacterized protein DUF422 n=1 Tax=Chitinophaga polysaccharea TaxID=1293035 RepID=A0A561Q2V1_9BACT|nr:carotenoid biosynthesis protein [Chitinophaga polysaccharea]TWF44695.1 uncharacterized protein DUF422 [Chitinophaga polysaccharea]